MERRKKLIMLVIVLLIVIFIVLCFAGYGVKKLKKDKDLTNNIPLEAIDFPQKSDDDVFIGEFFDLLDNDIIKTPFSNFEKENNGNTFVFECAHFDKNDAYCSAVNLKVNNELSLNYLYHDLYKTIDFYKVNNYYVVIEYDKEDQINLRIFDKTKQVYSNYLVHSSYWLDKDYINTDNKKVEVKPIIINKTLHFVEEVNGDVKLGNSKLKYSTIDLSKNVIEVNLLKEFEGYYNPVTIYTID